MSHDATLKTLFAEPAVIRDLIRFHLPQLQGFRPLFTQERTTVVPHPVAQPHHDTRIADLIWVLEREGQKVLLHLEFQSRPDTRMTIRVLEYEWRMLRQHRIEGFPHGQDLRVFSLVIHTGPSPFGTWERPYSDLADSHLLGFQEGPLLDIHAYPVPDFPDDTFPLSRHSLVTGIVALARVQVAIRAGHKDAVHQILPVLQSCILPRVREEAESLAQAYGAWFRVAFAPMVADLPALRQALHNVVYIAEAEAIMETFGQVLEQSVAEGIEQGIEQGRREVLLEYVREIWGTDEARRFAPELDQATPDQMPTVTSLRENYRVGQLPRLRDTAGGSG